MNRGRSFIRAHGAALAWGIGLSSVLLFPASRNMRMTVLFVTLLAVASLRLRPWLAALSVVALASWVVGPKGVQFGWTSVLMICAGLAAADFASGHMKAVRRAIPWLSLPLAASVALDLFNGYQGAGTLDNTIVAGPIFALLAALSWRENQAASLLYMALVVIERSTTGALVLAASFAPLVPLSRRAWSFVGASLLVFVAFIDQCRVGYAQRLEVIYETAKASILVPLGHGWGAYDQFSFSLPRTWAGERYSFAHSDLTQLWFEAGLVPLLLVLAYLVRVCRTPLTTQRRRIAVGAVAGLAVFSLVGFPWHVAPSAAVGLLVLANYEGEVNG